MSFYLINRQWMRLVVCWLVDWWPCCIQQKKEKKNWSEKDIGNERIDAFDEKTGHLTNSFVFVLRSTNWRFKQFRSKIRFFWVQDSANPTWPKSKLDFFYLRLFCVSQTALINHLSKTKSWKHNFGWIFLYFPLHFPNVRYLGWRAYQKLYQIGQFV